MYLCIYPVSDAHRFAVPHKQRHVGFHSWRSPDSVTNRLQWLEQSMLIQTAKDLGTTCCDCFLPPVTTVMIHIQAHAAIIDNKCTDICTFALRVSLCPQSRVEVLPSELC